MLYDALDVRSLHHAGRLSRSFSLATTVITTKFCRDGEGASEKMDCCVIGNWNDLQDLVSEEIYRWQGNESEGREDRFPVIYPQKKQVQKVVNFGSRNKRRYLWNTLPRCYLAHPAHQTAINDPIIGTFIKTKSNFLYILPTGTITYTSTDCSRWKYRYPWWKKARAIDMY